MPTGSRTDPPMAKVELVSDRFSTSGLMYLRGEKSYCATENCTWRVRICERNSPVDTQVSEEGGGGGTPGTGAEIPLQPVRKLVVRKVTLCSPMRSTVEQPMEDLVVELADAQRKQ
ncbi:protein pxr1-like [Pitangus sulphuratus]|nr:protein pxr1-like [Pitangus sulphuratus]